MAMNSESTFIKTSLAAAFAVGLWLGGTATSAGAVAASVLAQARNLSEFAARVQEVEDDILAMTRTEQIFGEQAWLRALEGTALAQYQVVAFDITRLTLEAVKPFGLGNRDGREPPA